MKKHRQRASGKVIESLFLLISLVSRPNDVMINRYPLSGMEVCGKVWRKARLIGLGHGTRIRLDVKKTTVILDAGWCRPADIRLVPL